MTGNSALKGGGVYQATLNTCLLTGNSASLGGGAEGGTLNNCLLTGNSANSGGGAALGTLNNCTLTGNRAETSGGGAFNASLNNCTLTGNRAIFGRGVSGGILHNTIVYYNQSGSAGNYSSDSILSYCCTTPLPTNGPGSFTNAPLFVDLAGGNLRLQRGSPCLNAGLNDFVSSSTDLDGNPRIIGGTVDIGAYEYQSPVPGSFRAWLQSYGLPNDGSADDLDGDLDGMSNRQEWVAGTDPTNAASVLRFLAPVRSRDGWLLSWSSVSNHTYFLERSAQWSGVPGFSSVQSNIVGHGEITSFTERNAPESRTFYYRVGLQQ